MKQVFGQLVAVLSFTLGVGDAGAATLNVSGGQLLGASGVIVNGSSYNVEFLDGTCIDLYNGCDDISDFTFQTEADALLASQALLGQVFLDEESGAFDSVPELTIGCTNLLSCDVFVPYGFDSMDRVRIGGALNAAAGGAADGPTAFTLVAKDLDLTSQPRFVYTVWTVVPEPGPALLMGLGLVAMAARTRREHLSQARPEPLVRPI